MTRSGCGTAASAYSCASNTPPEPESSSSVRRGTTANTGGSALSVGHAKGDHSASGPSSSVKRAGDGGPGVSIFSEAPCRAASCIASAPSARSHTETARGSPAARPRRLRARPRVRGSPPAAPTRSRSPPTRHHHRPELSASSAVPPIACTSGHLSAGRHGHKRHTPPPRSIAVMVLPVVYARSCMMSAASGVLRRLPSFRLPQPGLPGAPTPRAQLSAARRGRAAHGTVLSAIRYVSQRAVGQRRRLASEGEAHQHCEALPLHADAHGDRVCAHDE